MRVLGTVVQIAVLPMLHARQDFPLGSTVAVERIGDDDLWHVREALEELAEELRGSLLVAPPLHQDVEYVSVLIDGPPQVVALLVDREEHLIHVPRVARPRTPPPELIGVLLATLQAPLAARFVRHDHAADEQPFFHVAVTEIAAEIEPDGMADHLTRKTMMCVEIG